MNNINYLKNLGDITFVTYIIKVYFNIIFTYYTFIRITNNKLNINIKNIMFLFTSILIAVLCGIVKYNTTTFMAILTLLLLCSLTFSTIFKSKIGYIIITTLISFSINYIMFMFAVMISFFPNLIIRIENDLINLAIIIPIYFTFLLLFSKIKKFKNGFNFLKNKSKDDYFDIFVLNISLMVLFINVIANTYLDNISNDLFLGFIIFVIVMFITIQKSITVYYKQKLFVKQYEQTKTELKEKEEKIAKLEAENLNFSKVAHSISHKQNALEFKLNEFIQNANSQTEFSEELEIKNRLQAVSKEYAENIIKTRNPIELPKTNIQEIDDMLKYMQSECNKNNIEFNLILNGNIHYMINHYISKEKLETLIADHIKDAIIAINSSKHDNRTIMVSLGIINNCYEFCINDSGIEFEINTLINLGLSPTTTHKDIGGSGIGFMTTFDTLKCCKASLVIEEFCPADNSFFTKAVKFVFDNKGEYKIISYRADEIRKFSKDNRIILTNRD